MEPWLMVNLVPKNTICPCVMLMRPSRAGLLAVPRRRRLASAWRFSVREVSNWVSGAVLIWTSKFRPPRKPVRADGVRTGSADFASSELKSDSGLKPVRRTVMVPASMLRSERPGQIQAGVGDGADTFGIAHAHLRGLRVQPENDRTAAVAGEAGDLDLAAAGFAAQALDGGAVAGEQDHAVGLRDAVGETGDIHGRVVDLHAAVDLGRVERPAHGGIGGDACRKR